MCLIWNLPSAEICLGQASLGQPWQILLPSWDKWQVLVWHESCRPYLRQWWTDWCHFQGRMFFFLFHCVLKWLLLHCQIVVVGAFLSYGRSHYGGRIQGGHHVVLVGLCLFYFLLGWMCQTRCHVEKCCFLVSDEGEKFGAGEAGIVHISLAVCFWHQCYIQACGCKKNKTDEKI